MKKFIEPKDVEKKPYKADHVNFRITKKRQRYYNGYADFGDGHIIKDEDVAKIVNKHLRLIDRLDVRKVTEASLLVFGYLASGMKFPEGKWYF